MATRISTYEELQSRLEEIVRAVAGDFRLALAAAANPLLALQELGYELQPRVSAIVEERARYSRLGRRRLREARRQVEAAAGHPFDPGAPEQLHTLLNGEFGLGIPTEFLGPLSFRRPPERDADALAEYAEAHPVVPLLLAYRALLATAPPLADEDDYRRLRSGEIDPPLTQLRVRRAGSDEVLATAKRR